MYSKLRERKAILSASLIASFLLLFLVIPTPVYSQASSHLEPQQINVEIIQGQTLIKKITLKNIWNQSLNGSIEVLNVECGLECPWVKLSIDRLDLKPNESLEAEIEIRSHLLNRIGITTLSIRFYPDNDYRNDTTIDLNINVTVNYLIYLGLPTTIISAIIIAIVYWRKKKKKNKIQR